MKIKKLHLLIILLVSLVNPVWAAELTASVDSNQVDFGKSFQLKLLLTGAEATEPLELSRIPSSFMVYEQQQYSSYVSTNGKVTAETGWNITLLPRGEGEFTIPSVSVQTNKGRVNSNAIKIRVTSQGVNQSKADDINGVSLVATVSKAKTYIKQPIIYTLKIIAYKPIVNINLDDIKSNDAIIEKIGEVKRYAQNIGGMTTEILELNYAVTPLKTGKIKIIPAVFRGEVQVPRAQASRAQRFGLYNQVFIDNSFDLKPFSAKGEVVTINAMDIPGGNNNLLALDKLTIAEKWDGLKQLKVGDTFTRKITIIAHGTFANQLPSVKDYMDVDGLKVYANKPVTVESIDQNGISVIGRKEEEFSLVTQKAGTITLPEIKIQWWNATTQKLEESVLPAKTLEVMPAGSTTSANNTMIDYSSADEPVTIAEPTAKVEMNTANNNWWYTLIALLLGIIISLFAVVIYLLRKKPVPINTKTAQPPKRLKVTNPIELRQMITEHAIKHWQAPRNITLNKLGAFLTDHNYSYELDAFLELSNEINAVLYAKGAYDLTNLQELWEVFKNSVIKSSVKSEIKVKSVDYTNINPT